MNTDKTDFTQGSILKKLSLFMLPILGALVLQAAYGAVDLLVVGRFGSTGSQVLNLPFAYCMSIQPDASLAKIGLAAPISTVVGIALNIAFYIYWNRKNADS